MATASATLLAAVAQLNLLQVDAPQGEIYQAILDNALLSSSLFVNIALAGLATILFVYMGRNVSDPRAKLIVVSTLLVPLVSISSYTGLASGLTVGLLDASSEGILISGSTIAGQENVVFSVWGRYLTWALSTPAILLALGLLAGSNLTKIFTIITTDIAMCVTGLAAAFTTSSLVLRWFYYALSCSFFGVVLYILLVEWPKDAQATGTISIFNSLKLLTVTLWLGYPIFWALGAEGLGVIGAGVTSWLYSILDIAAKYIFSYLLISYVTDEPAGVTSGAKYGATAPGVTPSDD
jgi:Bacteriorhodopsin